MSGNCGQEGGGDGKRRRKSPARDEEVASGHAGCSRVKVEVGQPDPKWKEARKKQAASKRAAKALRQSLEGGTCPPAPKKGRASSLDDPFEDDFGWPEEGGGGHGPEHIVEDEELAHAMAAIDAYLPHYTAAP